MTDRVSFATDPSKLKCPCCGGYVEPLSERESAAIALYRVGRAGLLYKVEPLIPQHEVIFVCRACEPMQKIVRERVQTGS